MIILYYYKTFLNIKVKGILSTPPIKIIYCIYAIEAQHNRPQILYYEKSLHHLQKADNQNIAQSGRSFIRIMNSSGPKLAPWGTSEKTSNLGVCKMYTYIRVLSIVISLFIPNTIFKQGLYQPIVKFNLFYWRVINYLLLLTIKKFVY